MRRKKSRWFCVFRVWFIFQSSRLVQESIRSFVAEESARAIIQRDLLRAKSVLLPVLSVVSSSSRFPVSFPAASNKCTSRRRLRYAMLTGENLWRNGAHRESHVYLPSSSVLLVCTITADDSKCRMMMIVLSSWTALNLNNSSVQSVRQLGTPLCSALLGLFIVRLIWEKAQRSKPASININLNESFVDIPTRSSFLDWCCFLAGRRRIRSVSVVDRMCRRYMNEWMKYPECSLRHSWMNNSFSVAAKVIRVKLWFPIKIVATTEYRPFLCYDRASAKNVTGNHIPSTAFRRRRRRRLLNKGNLRFAICSKGLFLRFKNHFTGELCVRLPR